MSLRSVRKARLSNPTCNGSSMQPLVSQCTGCLSERPARGSCSIIGRGESAFICVGTFSSSEPRGKAEADDFMSHPAPRWAQGELREPGSGLRLPWDGVHQPGGKHTNSLPSSHPCLLTSALSVTRGSTFTATLSGTCLRAGGSRGGGRAF